MHPTYDNDQDHEKIQAISRLRNGKELQDPYTSKGKEKMGEEEDREEAGEPSPCDGPLPSTYKPPIPYPSALESSRSSTDHEKRLLENFRKATMTVAVEDAIKCTPTLKIYLKDSYTHRKPKEIVKLSECASSILNSTPKKRGDPRGPLITCEISGKTFSKVLLDTGASISIMPKAIHDEYDFGVELEEVCMDLLLADGTIRQPEGRLSDVMIIVENCEIHVDFVVTEVRVKGDLSLAPIILGRPFLVTARTIMDWEKGTVEFKVGGEKVTMDLSKMMKSTIGSGENIAFF